MNNGFDSGSQGGGFYTSSFAQPEPGVYGVQQQGGGGYYVQPQQGPLPAASFEDEPPLLEELGIYPEQIAQKAKAVMNPFSKYDRTFADDADMTGPLCFCVALGILLVGKLSFGIIYSQSIVSCLTVYLLFNLMSDRGIELYGSTSIIGYAMLPMVLLALVSLFVPTSLKVIFGTIMITWSTSTAAKIFVAVLEIREGFWLVAYPLGLVYTSFAIITVFAK